MTISGLGTADGGYAVQAFNSVNQTLQAIGAQLASGSLSAEVDSASAAISDELDATAASEDQAAANADDAGSLLAVADGALSSISDIASQMGALAVESGNSTLSASDQQAIGDAYQALSQQINQVVGSTTFNDMPVFGQTDTFQVGATGGAESQLTTTLPAISAASLGLDGSLGLAGAGTSIESVDDALGSLASARAGIGATSAAVGSAQTLALNSADADRAASSVMNDTDYASVTAAYQQAMLQQSSSLYAVQAYSRQAIQPLSAILAS